MFKKIVQKKLERYVVKYFRKHPQVKLIIVAGSVGKTSTKRAIATLLSTRYRVQLHEGNYNTHMSVPVTILGVEYPAAIHSIGAWISVFRAARARIRKPAAADVIIAELGADRPGDIAYFGKYLKPYMSVITAVTPEHMEFFTSIEQVAQEELTAANFAQLVLINRDDIDGRFSNFLTNPNIDTYGTSGAAEYRFEIEDFSVDTGYKGSIIAPEYPQAISAMINVVGEHSLRPVMGAVAVAGKMGLTPVEVATGLAELHPVPGRMNLLHGLEGSVIIDDTYNSSPIAASSALQALYSLQVPQRIAVLGSMNELGAVSAAEHEKLGLMCDSSLLAWVVTIGDKAEEYLAPAARRRGCQVKSFKSAIDAGSFVHSVMEQGAAVLVKGSQSGVYAEEAVKIICVMDDDAKLVRQSPEWIKKKDEFFSKFA